MNRTQRVQVLSEHLGVEGYKPTIDSDGDIVFKSEGKTFFIALDDDEEFFRLILPNFWSIDSESERLRAQAAAMAVCRDVKVAKVFAVRDNMWASIELFSSSTDNSIKVLHRSMLCLIGAIKRFAEEMSKE